jgi:hypothetical protein
MLASTHSRRVPTTPLEQQPRCLQTEEHPAPPMLTPFRVVKLVGSRQNITPQLLRTGRMQRGNGWSRCHIRRCSRGGRSLKSCRMYLTPHCNLAFCPPQRGSRAAANTQHRLASKVCSIRRIEYLCSIRLYLFFRKKERCICVTAAA